MHKCVYIQNPLLIFILCFSREGLAISLIPLLEGSSKPVSTTIQRKRTKHRWQCLILNILKILFPIKPSLWPVVLFAFFFLLPSLFIELIFNFLQIKSCLKDYLANPLNISRSDFDGKDWIGTFNLYMSSIDILKRDPYHRAKYEADCASWARGGMCVMFLYSNYIAN